MAILIDFNQITIAAISAGAKHFAEELNSDMIRHMILGMLAGYKKKFSEKYGELVICVDGPNSWRKEFFPYYKAKRAEGRAESPLDWKLIFDTLNSMHNELDEFFPYKVVKVDRCEGDDVIAVMVKYFATNELVQNGLDESPQQCLIVSSDRDFIQLQVYPFVDQWTPMFKKFIREPNPVQYRIEKIIGGDAGDGVPNIFSDDDTFVAEPKKRQTPCTEKRMTPILESVLKSNVVPEAVARNYDRNMICIDLVNCVPEKYETEIICKYENAKVAPRSELLTYFMKFKLKNLMSDFDKF